jgi:ABC-type multidrug transport system fused ATPase/permease subunit
MRRPTPEPEIEEILLDDIAEEILPERPTSQKRHRYIPFLPRMYWFFYRRPVYFLLFIPSLVSSWIMTYSNLSMGVILDSLNEPDAVAIIKRRAFLNFCAAIAAAIFQFLKEYGWASVGDLISIKIKRVLFKAMLQKDVEFFDTHPIGDLLTLLNEDVSSVKSAFEIAKAVQIRAMGNLIASMVVSFSIDWRLALFAVAWSGLSSRGSSGRRGGSRCALGCRQTVAL